MKPTKQLKFANCLVVTTLFFSAGCQSGFVKKPNFGKLAFWKKDDLRLAATSDDIPPPSAHFSPDRATVDDETKQQLQETIDQIVADSKRSKGKISDPIRKPYSLDSVDPKIGSGGSNSKSQDFVLNKKLNQIQSAAQQTLSLTENAVKKTGEIVEDRANSFAGWKNDLQTSGENQIQQTANSLKNQANTVISNTTDAVNSFARKTENSVGQTVSTVKNSLDNSFTPQAGEKLVSNPYTQQENDANQGAEDSNTTSESPSGDGKTVVDRDSAKPGFQNKPLVNPQPMMSDVQQSSFNATLNKNTAKILQPVAGANANFGSQSKATKYPTTSYGLLRSANQERSTKTETGNSVEIPALLLRGNSSFSPGSTKPLRPANSEN